MKKTLSLITLASLLLTSVSYAEKVEYPIGQKKGSFHCLASDPGATVTIQTDGVDLQGACKGQPYSDKDGRLDKLPVDVLNRNNFLIQKLATKAGSVKITVTNGSVVCKTGRAEGRDTYGKGSKYCLIPFTEELN